MREISLECFLQKKILSGSSLVSCLLAVTLHAKSGLCLLYSVGRHQARSSSSFSLLFSRDREATGHSNEASEEEEDQDMDSSSSDSKEDLVIIAGTVLVTKIAFFMAIYPFCKM